MDTRRLGLVVLAFLLPVMAHADRHKIGFRGALVDARRSNIWGLQFSADFPFYGEQDDNASQGPKLGTLGLVTELSMVAGTHSVTETEKQVHLSQFTGLLGLRYSFNRFLSSHAQLFVQGQAGFAKERQDDVRRDLMAFAWGIGLHIPLGSTSPDDHPALGLCLQYDRYGIGTSPTEWYSQLSAGFVPPR